MQILQQNPIIMRFVLGLFKPRKTILGTDFAGKVESTGENVKSFSLDDKVFCFIDTGAQSQATYIITKVENLFLIPKKVDFEKATASLEGAHDAYSFIQKTNIKSGQNILINGANGGIGSALLQYL